MKQKTRYRISLAVLITIFVVLMITIVMTVLNENKQREYTTVPNEPVTSQIKFEYPPSDEPVGVTRVLEHKEAQRVAAEKAEAERIAAEQAEAERVAAEQAVYETQLYSEPVYDQSYSYEGNGGGLTKSGGVNYYNGNRETYYSSNVLYHYRTGEWTLGGDGVYRDSDGYVVVASSDQGQGSTIDTSFGPGKVYDSGCASGTVDIYTKW